MPAAAQTEEERRLEAQLVKQAQQGFKSVQGFMGDRHYSFPVRVCELTRLVEPG